MCLEPGLDLNEQIGVTDFGKWIKGGQKIVDTESERGPCRPWTAPRAEDITLIIWICEITLCFLARINHAIYSSQPLPSKSDCLSLFSYRRGQSSGQEYIFAYCSIMVIASVFPGWAEKEFIAKEGTDN